MWRQDYGATRKKLREGSGRDVAPEHYDEVLKSSEFFVYIPPGGKLKGYPEIKAFLESEGCTVEYPGRSDMLPNQHYTAVAISSGGRVLSDAALRRVHKWAHKRNFLHSFFQPLAPRE